MAHERAGQPARSEDLIDVAELVTAYYTRVPDAENPEQQVSFGTSGHRGSALDGAFNEGHVAAIAQVLGKRGGNEGVQVETGDHACIPKGWRGRGRRFYGRAGGGDRAFTAQSERRA